MKKQKTVRLFPKQEVVLYTTFTFGFYTNATNVANALASSGYLVNIRPDGTSYTVDIFKRV